MNILNTECYAWNWLTVTVIIIFKSLSTQMSSLGFSIFSHIQSEGHLSSLPNSEKTWTSQQTYVIITWIHAHPSLFLWSREAKHVKRHGWWLSCYPFPQISCTSAVDSMGQNVSGRWKSMCRGQTAGKPCPVCPTAEVVLALPYSNIAYTLWEALMEQIAHWDCPC